MLEMDVPGRGHRMTRGRESPRLAPVTLAIRERPLPRGWGAFLRGASGGTEVPLTSSWDLFLEGSSWSSTPGK